MCDAGAYVVFDTPQRGITPGQFAAWYDGDELVGSGVIDRQGDGRPFGGGHRS